MTCPSCHYSLESTFYFCPNCGKQVQDKALSLSFGKQFSVYFLSFFFPPFGFWPAYRYLTQEGIGAKSVGLFATCLLIASCALVTYEIGLLWKVFAQILPMLQYYQQMLGY